MSSLPIKLPLYEKIGYALGDAAANFVWRGALAYMAIFYTDTFGITATHAALLMLCVRLSDGVTDILMGLVADRTNTRWGKFRPWILWSSPVLGLFMVLCYTTPNLSYSGKIIYASVTYICLTLAYTVNNVPYSALMGVMTPDPSERAVLSGFRFAGAFGGGLLVMGFTLTFVDFFGKGNNAQGYQYTMYLFAALLVGFCLITYFSTKERVVPVAKKQQKQSGEVKDLIINFMILLLPLSSISIFFYFRDIYSAAFFILCMFAATIFVRHLLAKPKEKLSHTQHDLIDLITNKPWLILLAAGFMFMLFTSIRYSIITYYFKYYFNDEKLAQTYFIALLTVSMLTAVATGYITNYISKKNLFALSFIFGGIFNGILYFLNQEQLTLVFIFGCLSEIPAAIMPVLFFSMLGDTADYSEWKNNRRATGLVFAAGTFINKTGGGFAVALVLLVLAGYGYNAEDSSTVDTSIEGIKLLMSWIPAVFSFIGLGFILFYPLTTETLNQIEQELIDRRSVS